VHKKRQENFTRITHKRVIKAFDASRESVDLWLRYLKQNGIGGVGIRARVHEFVEFGYGRREVEGVEKQFEELGLDGIDDGDVQKAADELIKKLTGEVDALAAEEAASGEGETGVVEQIRDAAEHSEDKLKTAKNEGGMATAAVVDEVVESEPVNKVDKDGKEIEGSAEEGHELAIPQKPSTSRAAEKDHASPQTQKQEKKEKKDKSLATALLNEAEEEVVRPKDGVKAKTGNQSEQKDEAKAAAAEVGTTEPIV